MVVCIYHPDYPRKGCRSCMAIAVAAVLQEMKIPERRPQPVLKVIEGGEKKIKIRRPGSDK